MKKLTLVLIAFIGVSCTKQKPEDIALQFYNYLNQNQFEKAKELAAPSAKEFIDKLSEIVKEYPTSDTVPIQLMDVKKKENPVQGDTAIVNYKFGKFKSAITLVMTDGSYKVVYSDELPVLRVITINSIDLNDKSAQLDYNIFKDRFFNYRFRINYLISEGIPYDVKSNTAYVSGFSHEGNNLTDVISLCGNPIQLKLDKFYKSTNYKLGIHSNFNFDFIDDADRDAFRSTYEKIGTGIIDCNYEFKCKNYYSIEGILKKKVGTLFFTECTINTKSCNK